MNTTVGFLIIASSISTAHGARFQSATPNDDIAFTQIETGVDSPIKKSGIKVITTQEQWDAFIAKMNETNVKHPKVDWTKYQVVVATLEGSTNSGITLHVNRLHPQKSGKTDIEFVLDAQPGNSPLIDTTNSNNFLGKTQYPYAILQTPIMTTKWNIKVAE